MDNKVKEEFRKVVKTDPKNAGKWMVDHLNKTGNYDNVDYTVEMLKIYVGRE